MKKSILAIVLLGLLGGAGYWLQNSGKLATYLPAVSSLTGSGGKDTAKPADAGGKSGQGQQKGAGAGGNRGPVPVEVAVANTTILSDDIAAIGSLLSAESVDIAPETSGRVTSILFKDGAEVKQGDVLFKFDADLISAQVADAKAKLALAEANFARNSTLLNSRTIAQSTYDQSATELSLARSALNLAEVALSKLNVRAPFDGTLGFSQISTGAYVSAGTPLVHLERINRLKVSFSVPELEFTKVKLSQDVTVAADAVGGETFTAIINALDPLVDVNGRSLRVLADLDNDARKLRPGMLVRVSIKEQPRDAIMVPEAAIVPDSDKATIFVVKDGKARQVAVNTGKRKDGLVEITSGITGGDKVVVAGSTRLSNGANVQIVSPQAAN